MRTLVVVFLVTALLAGCDEKAKDEPAQRSSGAAAKRVFDQLGAGADKRIKKEHN